MIEDEKIIEMFFERSEQGIRKEKRPFAISNSMQPVSWSVSVW